MMNADCKMLNGKEIKGYKVSLPLFLTIAYA